MTTDKPVTAGQVLLIPSDRIYPNPNQPRKVFDQGELVNLAISIRMNGILQPITVRQTEQGYELVSGERRLRASRIAGMLSVPCIVIDVNSLKSAVFSLIENLQRQDLGYFEEAAAILVNQYTALAGSTVVESTPAPGVHKEEDDSGLMLPIEELDLSARTANALLNNDIKTIRDLVMLSESDLKDLKGFGTKALDEVKEKLTELNI